MNRAHSSRDQVDAQVQGFDAVVAHVATPSGRAEAIALVGRAERIGDAALVEYLRRAQEAAEVLAAERGQLESEIEERIRFFHGSPVALSPGDALQPGTVETSPYKRNEPHVYITDSASAAGQWAADASEMQGSDDPGYVYEVEARGAIYQPHEDDLGQHVAPTAVIVARVR